MKNRKSRMFLTCFVLASWAFFCWGSVDVLGAPPRGVLREAIHWGLSADYLDPATAHYDASTHLTLYLFHDALFKPMPEGTYTPCLAESWKTSPDYKVYEFKLRKGVKFHNGDTMTAEDVVFSFWRNKASQAQFVHGRTEKVEATDPYTVRFQFKTPFPDFMDYCLIGVGTFGWVVPKKYVEKVGDAGFKRHPVGAGPYKFVEFVAGVRVVGEAFEGYWRKVPNFKRIEINIVSEASTRLAMVRRNEVDIATLMTGVFYEDVKRDPKLRLVAPYSPNRWLFYMASQWDPKSPWSDPRVRKAASLAIDRQTLADVHMPGCAPIGSLGLPGDPMRVDFPPDPYNPEGAKKLLAEAGYPKGFHGGVYWPYDEAYRSMGEQIGTYLKAVGITLDSRLLDRPAWFANRQGGKMKDSVFFDPCIAPTIAGRLTYLFGSASYGNYPDIQALWDQFQREYAPNTRKDLLARIQTLIHDRTMFIPLTSVNSPAAFGPKVKGNPYKIQPLIWFTTPFEDIEMND